MKILQSRSFRIGAALIVIGLVVCMYFLLTDQNDPDYAPPRFVIASIAGAWVVVAGIAVLLFSIASNSLGATACLWLGLCMVAFGILKPFAIDLESFEAWRISRVTTIPFDLAAATALALGGALILKSRALRRSQAEHCAARNP